MQLLLCLASLASIVIAAPASLESRAAATCGNNHYTSAQTNQASTTACNYVKSGSTAGSSTYPHVYNNYEGFNFGGLSGPFYEFPIISSGVYTGGSPGADRVIITETCKQAGTITHTGASGNNFVACEGTS